MEATITFLKKYKTAIGGCFLLGIGCSAISISTMEFAMAIKLLFVLGGAGLCGLGLVLLLCYLCRRSDEGEGYVEVNSDSDPYTIIKDNTADHKTDVVDANFTSYKENFNQLIGIIQAIRHDNFCLLRPAILNVPQAVTTCRSTLEGIVSTYEKKGGRIYEKYLELVETHYRSRESINKLIEELKVATKEMCQEAVKWKEMAEQLPEAYAEKLKIPKNWDRIVQESKSAPEKNLEHNNIVNYQC